jgi:hypothetical protein
MIKSYTPYSLGRKYPASRSKSRLSLPKSNIKATLSRQASSCLLRNKTLNFSFV